MNEKRSFLDDPLYLAPTDYITDASDDFCVLENRKDYLDAVAKEISEEIRHPVTIIDANRIDSGVPLNSIRANSSTEIFSLRYSCRLLRKRAGEDICFECDRTHALAFMDYLKIYDKGTRNPLETKPVCKIAEDINILSVKGFSRYVAEYRCPMSGYRELMIPLYYEKETIIGILFIGQTFVAGDKEYVKNTKRRFLDYEYVDNKPDLYAGMSEETIKQFKKNMIYADKSIDKYEDFLNLLDSTSIINASNEVVSKNFSMSFSDITQYFKFIESACKFLHKIEEDLTEIFNEKRRKYFEKKSRKIVNDYFDNIKAERSESRSDKESYSNLKTAWDSLLDAADTLKEEFNIQKIYIFGDGTSLAITDNKRKPLYLRDNAKTNLYYDYKTLDTIDIQNNDYYTSFYNLYHDKIYDGLDEKLNKSDHFIILFTNFVMVFCVKDFEKNKAIYESMVQEIGRQFVKINTSIALETSTFMQEKQIKTLRMNRHENAHISARITDRLEYGFGDKGEAFLKLSPDKRELVVDNLKNSAKLLSNMAENIGVVTGSITKDNIKPKINQVNVQEVLIKWQKMFRDILIDRNLNLELVRSYWDIWSMNIETVPNLFELLIYNIIDNAVKYAYRGTNVYISWDKVGGKNVFKATNYGHEIKDTDKIYDLYVRGAIHNSKRVDGDGIGLYSVKRICELLGCEISYTCNFVSEYNLPLIDWYKIKVGADGDIMPYVLDNYFDSVDVRTRRNILNLKNNEIQADDVSKDYLKRRIGDKMYKVVFTVEIPDKFEGGL